MVFPFTATNAVYAKSLYTFHFVFCLWLFMATKIVGKGQFTNKDRGTQRRHSSLRVDVTKNDDIIV